MSVRSLSLIRLLIFLALPLFPISVNASAPSNNGKIVAILIQVDKYGDGLKLTSPFSLSRSAAVMKDAIQRLGQAGGYKKENVQICEIIRRPQSEDVSQSSPASMPQVRGKQVDVGLMSYDSPRPNFCHSKNSPDSPPLPDIVDVPVVLSEVRALGNDASEEDTYIFYFTGHGESKGGTDIQLHLEDSSTQAGSPRYVLALNAVIDQLFKLPDSQLFQKARKLIFLDTCQIQSESLVHTGLDILKQFDISIFLSSSTTNFSPSYIDPRNKTGYFTRVLAEGLEGEAHRLRRKNQRARSNDFSLRLEDLRSYLIAELPRTLESDVANNILLKNKIQNIRKSGRSIQEPTISLATRDKNVFTDTTTSERSLSLLLIRGPGMKDLVEALEGFSNKDELIKIDAYAGSIRNIALGEIRELDVKIDMTLFRACNSETKNQLFSQGMPVPISGGPLIVGYIQEHSSRTSPDPKKRVGGIIDTCLIGSTPEEESKPLVRYSFQIVDQQDMGAAASSFLTWLVKQPEVRPAMDLSRSATLAITLNRGSSFPPQNLEIILRLCEEFPLHLKDHLNIGSLRASGIHFDIPSIIASDLCKSTSEQETRDYLRKVIAQKEIIINGHLSVKNSGIVASVAWLNGFQSDTSRLDFSVRSTLLECMGMEMQLELSPANWASAKATVHHLARHVAHALEADASWINDGYLQEAACALP